MSNVAEYRYDNREQLLADLLEKVTDILGSAVSKKGKASMLLSGGTTPGALYQRMSEVDLPWENIWFGPTDERWVDPAHEASNEKLVRETLCKNKAAHTHYIGHKTNFPDPVAGLAATMEQIKALPEPYDIVLLGMGSDGHVASLFPTSKDTPAALDSENKNSCHPIHRGAGEVPRMTMTLNQLLKADKVFILFYGVEKLAVFEEALKEKTEALPVSYILHQDKVPVTLYWAE